MRRSPHPVTARWRPTPQRARRRAQGGYNLVILMMGVTIMTILLAAALPLWSTAMKREREEELIFRGLQYAEAIRVYQRRFGSLPVNADDLIKKKPRSIRQLWTDPMTEDGEFELIPALWTGIPGQQRQPLAGSGPAPTRELGGGKLKASYPFWGVRSRSEEEAIKTFLGQQTYDQWVFALPLLEPQAAQGAPQANLNNPNAPNRGNRNQGGPNQANLFRGQNQINQGTRNRRPPQLQARGPQDSDQLPHIPSANTLGRPFPDGIQPPNAAALPPSLPTDPNRGGLGLPGQQRRGPRPQLRQPDDGGGFGGTSKRP